MLSGRRVANHLNKLSLSGRTTEPCGRLSGRSLTGSLRNQQELVHNWVTGASLERRKGDIRPGKLEEQLFKGKYEQLMKREKNDLREHGELAKIYILCR